LLANVGVTELVVARGCVGAVAGVAMAGHHVILQIRISSRPAAVGGASTDEILSQKQNDESKDHGFYESARGCHNCPAVARGQLWGIVAMRSLALRSRVVT